MAFFKISTSPLALLLSLSVFLHAAQGEFFCEQLPKEMCAFSIASSGKRCLLETYPGRGGVKEYQCRTSEVLMPTMVEWVETDECVNACGVDRNWVGISSDALMEPQFTAKLCSPACYNNCPNIADLYTNLAAGEGVVLRDLCKVQESNPRRAMAELLSSGAAAAGPVAGGRASMFAYSPTSPTVGASAEAPF